MTKTMTKAIFACLVASAMLPTSIAQEMTGKTTILVPSGSTVVARANGGAWQLLVEPAAVLGLPEIADCDQVAPRSNAFLTPDPTWPATSNSAAQGQCPSYVEMDTAAAGLNFVELRTTGDVGGSVRVAGPAGWLILACTTQTTAVQVGAPDMPWVGGSGNPQASCSLSGPAPLTFTTWWGYVENDNNLGDTYGVAG